MDDQAPLGESAEPPPKKLRESAGDTNAEEALSTGSRSSSDRGGADPHGHSGAAEHAAAACGSSRDPTGRQGPDAAGHTDDIPDFFRDATPRDIAGARWLRAHASDAKCNALFFQICEWKNQARDAARQLARQQEIAVTRRTRGTINGMMDAVREHFREAIAQQRVRIATLNALMVGRAVV